MLTHRLRQVDGGFDASVARFGPGEVAGVFAFQGITLARWADTSRAIGSHSIRANRLRRRSSAAAASIFFRDLASRDSRLILSARRSHASLVVLIAAWSRASPIV